ncbi:hypothetical protein [Streptomyces sp. NPDC056672]|uniref:hypothetical protein n=1 Tax=unclassified Streptomyces TaxID=2593676 RepID=UPI00368478BD
MSNEQSDQQAPASHERPTRREAVKRGASGLAGGVALGMAREAGRRLAQVIFEAFEDES